jgi:hypothetical protein
VCKQLDPARAVALLERQAALQAAARHVIAELDLHSVLGRAGHVRLIGSAVTGLMVWRDLDVHVLAPRLRARSAWAAMAPLAAHPRMHEVRYINQRTVAASQAIRAITGSTFNCSTRRALATYGSWMSRSGSQVMDARTR